MNCCEAELNLATSCGGTSKETVLKSTFVYESVHGRMKNSPADTQ